MSKKLSVLLSLLIVTTSAFAFADSDDPVRRTVIVRNGEVLMDDSDPPGKRAFVGVSLTQLTPELREFFGASKDAGVLVSSVSENGPAAKAGVRVGDVITSVNGKTTARARDISQAIRDNHAGDSIRIEVIRGKSRQTLVATAEEREMPEFRAFNLKDLENFTIPPGAEWHQRVFPSGGDEDLRARIRTLEKRLQELEKRLQK